MIVAVLGLLADTATSMADEAVPLRGGERTFWDETPVENTGPQRAEMVLNDLWKFQPARGISAERPAGQWGWLRVPGSWERGAWDAALLEGPLEIGSGDPWTGLKVETPSQSFPTNSIPGLDRAWLEREVHLPSSWAGRRITLDLERVATDAQVFFNGVQCGEVSWPGGVVEVTRAALPGEKNILCILVIASEDEAEVREFMDADRVNTSKALLKHRGIIGDVVLTSMPLGARLDGLFIQPSVRKMKLVLDLELAGMARSTEATLHATAVCLRNGETARTWAVPITIPAPDAQGRAVVRAIALPWADPKLWDFQQPNLYRLDVQVEGHGVADAMSERFGFREFRIEGRQFLLNEKPFFFRPNLIEERSPVVETIELQAEALLNAHFNVAEIWPTPDLIRGNPNQRPLIARVADEKGLPLIYPVGDPTGLFDPVAPEVSPATWAAWQRLVREAWKRVRNSPSVLIWVVAANRFAHADDQNPLRLGNRRNLDFTPEWQRLRQAPGIRLIEALKAMDPTRPVTSHHNANVGDLHTCNNYLNLHPLQEREDWPAVWAHSGDMPYMAIEFDAPFDATMTRGRRGHTGAATTEPWLTEFLAIYQGPQAYENEDPDYRTMITRTHQSGQDYSGVNVTSHSAFVNFTAWWIMRTLRAWRGYGVSGGMIHWKDGYGWKEIPAAGQQWRPSAMVPGQRGARVSMMRQRFARGPISEEISARLRSGDALVKGLAPTLAWVAGPPESFTAQHHIFTPGESVRRSAALVNDTRAPVPWTIRWIAELAASEVARGETSGEIGVGARHFEPIEFVLPASAATGDGRIHLTATIGNTSTEEIWDFQVISKPLPPKIPSGCSVALLDPEGTTTNWLQGVRVPFKAVSSDASGWPESGLLVLGRNALTHIPAAQWETLRPRIENLLANGGRVLLLAQDPDWLRANSAWRVARHVGRRFWPVPTMAKHPLLVGLDGEHFRDWRGAGTLRDPASTMNLQRPVTSVPQFGWHVNNTGSVASAALEKPHFGRWVPLLEGEFDLAFSPLMEARIGAGLVVWCGLDLEGREGGNEPAAAAFSQRLLAYLTSPLPPPPSTATTYIGDRAGAVWLEAMGLVFQKTETLPSIPGLVILADGAETVTDAALESFLNAGGRVLLLGGAAARLGFRLEERTIGGASMPPTDWPQTAGLSASDLRLRADISTPLLAKGANEVAARGLLGRRMADRGDGVAIAFPLMPEELPAKQKTYFRFSQWRLTRALSQLLTNLGAHFRTDREVFAFRPDETGPLPLAGVWRFAIESSMPGAESDSAPTADPGRDPRTHGWETPDFDDSTWRSIQLPQSIENAFAELQNRDGAFWFRRTFSLPESRADKTMVLELGTLDDFDEVWVNGHRIGATSARTKNAWNRPREYKIRPGPLRPGQNTIAIRCFDQYGEGGFTTKSPDSMALRLSRPPERPSPYVDGFRLDHELGDDYARYYRW